MTKPEQSRQGRLLLVDDEENILRSLKRVLRQSDWLVETAHDAESALEVLSTFKPEVVLSDFRMPGMNGVELLTRVKTLSPLTQRIMLTGQADQQAIEEAINRSEVFRFISKPWNDAQLVLTVRSAFEQHALLAENERLFTLTQNQNHELRELNAELEQRVAQRTNLLSKAKRDWELTFDTIDHPLLVVEFGELKVRRGNRAAATVAKREMVAIGDKPTCHAFLFGRDTPCPGCQITTGMKEPHAAEVQHDGRTYVGQLFPMEDEPVAVCSFRDVTDERSLTRRMVESEKMIAIGNLAGGVAHEINNPLGGILAFAQLMQRDNTRTPNDRESLQLIEESALRCKRIVESLLKFSRRSKAEDRRNFDLSRCMDDTVVLFRAQAKKYPRLVVELKLAQGLPQLYGDPSQVGQVALNLLQNSLHALPNGEGRITVETGTADAHCYFKVIDNGCGIPEENLSHIFEPHFTTKPPGEGTGLGLAIAYRIVEDHGGHFVVESSPGAGTTFTVMFAVQPGGAS
ncbi:MAG: response regulator [Myxococcaceae bacterium]|nr:response regulator [Myxococcaceae bacterium]